ncbi:uncharacterized protein B0I36DRAFT_331409 [Microdochium trichocladiopsis]|uniref:Uncharacterized protein n=1 Tax=Microdochium trichocladiopsis TaxID=1682393 RepID=A0A9P8XZC0_9PEZI|nr:uncharacterized protein B0I36DRAFT_331409 [Microdochium trichocladiopsis]KAH7024433.1 hypothetical protein B0I36DRAFT_331409 [Microdochium trichocladiopsis]
MASSNTAAAAINITHSLTIAALATLGGVALSLRVWVMPAISLVQRPGKTTASTSNPTMTKNNTITQIRQFNHVISLGFKYLQSSSRLIPVVLLGLAGVTWYHSNHGHTVAGVGEGQQVQQDWTHYLIALFALGCTAPWEAYLIFPINREIEAIGRALEGLEELEGRQKQRVEKGGEAADSSGLNGSITGEEDEERTAREVQRLFDKWQKWHTGRIVSPFFAVLILVGSGAGILPGVRLW